MAYTAQKVYDEVCVQLLEDGGLQFVYTEAAFLRDLASALVEFCQDTGFAVALLNCDTVAGDPDVTLPAVAMDVHEVFYRSRALLHGTAFGVGRDTDRLDTDNDSPEEWYVDELEAGTVRLSPPPHLTGSNTATVAASIRPTAASVTLGSTLELIPDTLACYLKWFVLRNIWATDGESKDMQRAQYAQARVDEVKNIVRAIIAEDLG